MAFAAARMDAVSPGYYARPMAVPLSALRHTVAALQELQLKWQQQCLGWRGMLGMLGFFACSTAVLAAIHWHDAATLAAARMAAAMLRLHCLAWLLCTGDGSACSGAQTRSDGIAAAALVAAAMVGLALTHSAAVHAQGRSLQLCLGTQHRHWLRLKWQQRCMGWRLTLLRTHKGGACVGS